MAEDFGYDELAADADEMIREAGMSSVLIKPSAATGAAYDPTPGAPLFYPCVAAVDRYQLHQIDGSRIMMGDKRVLLSTVGVPDDFGDEAAGYRISLGGTVVGSQIVGGQQYKIIAADTIKPAQIPVYYEVQCRK